VVGGLGAVGEGGGGEARGGGGGGGRGGGGGGGGGGRSEEGGGGGNGAEPGVEICDRGIIRPKSTKSCSKRGWPGSVRR